MKLIIVRHGETKENVAKIIQGQTYGNLTDVGIEQAKRVALYLKNENIDIAYVSDLERAKDTAKEILSNHQHTKVLEEQALRERAWGIWEGKKREERGRFLTEEGCSIYEYKPEGGESFFDVQKRIVAFYYKIINKHKKQTVLIVSHGGPLTALYLSIFQKDVKEYEKYHPQNTAITILEISEDKKHTVHLLNCVKHL